MNSLPTRIVVSTTRVNLPQLQREIASLHQQQLDPRNAHNLLRKVLKKGWNHLPTAQKLRAEHAELLLKTPIGPDFNLITAACVEFRATNHNSPSFVNLPTHFHPILVDRIVNFIYTSDYKFLPGSESDQLKQGTFRFHHATLNPNENSPSPATFALVDIIEYAYHLRIYALAEELDYEALKSAAHAKLVELLVFHSSDPAILREAIKTIFAPTGTAERICKDKDGALQQLVVAAVLTQEAKHWTEVQLTEFPGNIQGPQYATFRTLYTIVKEETGELIKQADIAKQLAAERKKGRDHRKTANSKRSNNNNNNKIFWGNSSPMETLGARSISLKDKFKRKRKEKRGVAAVAKADGDEDMDMEVD